MNMIKLITWEQIYSIWRSHLWPERTSAIESTSAMCYLGGHDLKNMESIPTFFGYLKGNKIVGVNSGHACPGTRTYRSRGLWVNPQHRKQGIGQELLNAVKYQGLSEGYKTVWSYPRKSSWKTYQAVGFTLSSEWQSSETSDANAYCSVTI